MKYFFIVFCILLSVNVDAQRRASKSYVRDTIIDGVKYSYVETMPSPSFRLNKYLSKNMHYPDSARAHNVEGRVIVKFAINENGSISDCEIEKGIDKECDEEALRVIKNMPRWNAGMQNGKPVKVIYHLPIVFSLK